MNKTMIGAGIAIIAIASLITGNSVHQTNKKMQDLRSLMKSQAAIRRDGCKGQAYVWYTGQVANGFQGAVLENTYAIKNKACDDAYDASLMATL